MMPTCPIKRCKNVAEKNLGKINTPNKDMPSGVWDETVYLCDKHYIKILKLLGQL